MKQIQPSNRTYKMKQDQRSYSLRFGRYVYLTIVFGLVFLVLHILFSHFYLLKGDGFVFATNRAVELEYDASIKALFVENGDTVKAGQELLRFDSVAYRSDLVDLLLKQVNLMQKFSESMVEDKRLETTIDASRQYKDLAEKIRQQVDALREKGFAPNSRVSIEALRQFNALRDLESLKAQKSGLNYLLNDLKKQLHIASANLNYLIEQFQDGLVKAESQGVIGGLEVTTGNVIKKGTPIMRIFSGPRYLYVYMEESFISHKLGDPVIVYIPGRGVRFGRIVDEAAFSSELPEEIAPKFRPAQRRAVVHVVTDQDLVSKAPIMGRAKIYKPVGLQAFCNFASCGKQYIEAYQEILKIRKSYYHTNRQKHQRDIKELFTLPDQMSSHKGGLSGVDGG